MQVSIRINNLMVEGIKPSTVKLTINNVDPFTIGERTNMYSATIKVPRTRTNDVIFARTLYPQIGWNTDDITNDRAYIAYVYFGGLTPPYTDGQFVVQCKLQNNEYTLNLVQNTSNLANASLPLTTAEQNGMELRGDTPDEEAKLIYNFRSMFLNATDRKGSIDEPPITLGFDSGYATSYVSIGVKDVKKEEVYDSVSGLSYLGAINTLTGGYYPTSYMRITDGLVEAFSSRYGQASTPVYMKIKAGSYIIADRATVGTANRIYLSCAQLAQGTAVEQMNCPFDYVGSGSTGEYSRYECMTDYDYSYHNTTEHARLGRRMDYYFHRSGVPANDPNNVRPSSQFPIEQAIGVAIMVGSVSVIDAHQIMPTGQPYKVSDLLIGWCKQWGWRYTYDYKLMKFKAKQIIVGHPTPAPKVYVDWQNKIDSSTAVYSEASGLGSEMVCKVGEVEKVAQGNPTNVTRRTNAFSSSLAVKRSINDGVPRVGIFDASRTIGGQYFEVSYYQHPKGYNDYIQRYFKPFKNSYQVVVDAKLSYFDIANFQDDALYRFGNLGGTYYLRKIENWDALTGKCKLTLIGVDL